jgi:hypothetical protein
MSWVIEYPATRGSSPKSTTTHSPKRFISMRSHNSTTNCLIFSGDRTVSGLHPWRSIPECKPQASTSSNSFRSDASVVVVCIFDVAINYSDNEGVTPLASALTDHVLSRTIQPAKRNKEQRHRHNTYLRLNVKGFLARCVYN